MNLQEAQEIIKECGCGCGKPEKKKKNKVSVKENFTSFSEYSNEDFTFDRYLDFLLEDVSLPVIQPETQEKTRVRWADVKAGFDKVIDIATRKKIGKAARKKRESKLLGAEGSNPKLAKEGESVPEFATKGLSLSPSDESRRINTCACATAECRAACLNKTGMGKFDNVQLARLNKTDYMLDHPDEFMAMLHDELDSHEKSATKRGKRAAVRLNVFSDIRWKKLHPEIFSQHPNIQFYDYTKIADNVLNPDGSKKEQPPNYHLTFSSTGIHRESNWKHARQHLDNGGVVAMVFAVRAGRKGRKGDPLPTHVFDEKTGKKYRVIDGDEHDHRHLDHVYNNAEPGEGLIAGLRLKGGKKMIEKAGDFAVRPDPDGIVRVKDIHGD